MVFTIKLEDNQVEIPVVSSNSVEIGDRVIVTCRCPLYGETGEVISDRDVSRDPLMKIHYCERI